MAKFKKDGSYMQKKNSSKKMGAAAKRKLMDPHKVKVKKTI